MKEIKAMLIAAYVVIGILTGIYGSIWGQYDYKGLAYNMGRGLMWPVVMFPSFGQVVALVVIAVFLCFKPNVDKIQLWTLKPLQLMDKRENGKLYEDVNCKIC